MHKLFAALLSLLIAGCLGYPRTVVPVKDFQIDKFLGKWYEIARLNHAFERNLQQVTAEYALLDNGGLKVVNRGYSTSENQWKEAVGKAYFVLEPTEGYLKVSFFGPFYGAYVVFELDRVDYQYAFVCGSDESYLWLLSRTPTVSDAMKNRFKTRAGELGFNADALIWVDQK